MWRVEILPLDAWASWWAKRDHTALASRAPGIFLVPPCSSLVTLLKLATMARPCVEPGGSLLAASVPWHALPCSTHIFWKHLKTKSTEKKGPFLPQAKQKQSPVVSTSRSCCWECQGGVLSLDFSSAAQTAELPHLAFADDFYPLGSLSPWAIPQFPSLCSRQCTASCQCVRTEWSESPVTEEHLSKT